MIVDIINSDASQCMTGSSIIDFYADWCVPCKSITPLLEELSEKYNTVTIAKCNVEDNDELIDKYNIKNIPTLIFLKDGEVKERLTGSKKLEQLEEKLREIL